MDSNPYLSLNKLTQRRFLLNTCRVTNVILLMGTLTYGIFFSVPLFEIIALLIYFSAPDYKNKLGSYMPNSCPSVNLSEAASWGRRGIRVMEVSHRPDSIAAWSEIIHDFLLICSWFIWYFDSSSWGWFSFALTGHLRIWPQKYFCRTPSPPRFHGSLTLHPSLL